MCAVHAVRRALRVPSERVACVHLRQLFSRSPLNPAQPPHPQLAGPSSGVGLVDSTKLAANTLVLQGIGEELAALSSSGKLERSTLKSLSAFLTLQVKLGIWLIWSWPRGRFQTRTHVHTRTHTHTHAHAHEHAHAHTDAHAHTHTHTHTHTSQNSLRLRSTALTPASMALRTRRPPTSRPCSRVRRIASSAIELACTPKRCARASALPLPGAIVARRSQAHLQTVRPSSLESPRRHTKSSTRMMTAA